MLLPRWIAAACCLVGGVGAVHADLPLPVMPGPAETTLPGGAFRLAKHWAAAVSGADQDRVRAALGRMREHWSDRSGASWRTDATEPPILRLAANTPAPPWPTLGEDESYALTIGPTGVDLRAPTSTGVLRGLATLEQLLQSDGQGWYLPAVSIRDRPRFAWRGLMIDVSRHWQPVEVIERTLDGMALVKLNVFHWHLTDDQGFRVASLVFPRLTALGSDGLYYTQHQIREVVAYAAARGIRVVPEFDLPGHTTSWLVAYPELGSAPGPFAIARRWGIHDPVFDPTNEALYPFLDRFFAEMAGLFPDAYVHIGGDEVKGVEWSANPRIQAAIKAQGLVDNAGLQTAFNTRLLAIVSRHHRRMIGWDEIFHPGLPKETVIESWRGREGLEAASAGGYGGILASGFYLDHCRPAGYYYANDPLPASTKLSPAEQGRILGGEAAMWGEYATPETIESRIWPAAAAVAERLWSPVSFRDTEDMYRRLARVSQRLEDVGVRHEANREVLIRRLAGGDADPDELAALEDVLNILEGAGLHDRYHAQPDLDQFSPLTGLADCARPESAAARSFGAQVDRVLAQGQAADPMAMAALKRRLGAWWAAAEWVAGPFAARSPRIAADQEVFVTTARVCRAGLAALDRLHAPPGSAPLDPTLLTGLDLPDPSAIHIAILAPVRRLIAAAQKPPPAP